MIEYGYHRLLEGAFCGLNPLHNTPVFQDRFSVKNGYGWLIADSPIVSYDAEL